MQQEEMTTGAELDCPGCGRVLEPQAWRDAGSGACPGCRESFEFVGFPAANVRRAGAVPRAVLLAERARCFHHPDIQAESVCEECGRFLCGDCAVYCLGRLLCPGCIGVGPDPGAGPVGPRVLHGRIALGLAVLPLIAWPATLVTAPVALGAVGVGWRKPGSLTGRGRAMLAAAGLIALAEIAAWAVFLAAQWLGKTR